LERDGLEDQVENLKERVFNLEMVINNLKSETRSLKEIYLENVSVYSDYSKLTVIVPYRKTNDPEREENVDITLGYLSKIGIKNLIISEHSDKSSSNFFEEKYGHLFDSFRVIFSKSDGSLFNKAHAINKGVMVSKTPYFAIVDIDCLTEKKNVDMALYLLDKGFEVVHPFNRVIQDILDKNRFQKEYNFQNVDSRPQFRDWADGGIVFWNKRAFINIGMKNEYFIGWGGEDNEILIRANLFQLKQIRIDSTLYHLYHSRPQIRTENNKGQALRISEIKSKEDLLNEIEEWEWVV
jgi:Glycosyltransferases, probably involved in cell wall biogenesis